MDRCDPRCGDFVSQLTPLIERHDTEGMLACLDRFWPHDSLMEMLSSDEPDAVKIALVCLAFVGRMSDTPRIARLLHSPDSAASSYAEHALWSIWFRSGDEIHNIDLTRAVGLIGHDRFEDAIEQLDALIAMAPRFAEAYNQRAIACFLIGEYDRATEDCKQALRLNPFHFGAMAGLGHCYATAKKLAAAMEAYRAALAIHPRLEGIRQSIQCIRECLGRGAGQGDPLVASDNAIDTYPLNE